MKVQHPCKGMTKAQIRAFEFIAINQHPRCTKVTLDALLTAGVIRDAPTTQRDALGLYTIPNYYVPIPIHKQWCEWCNQTQVPGDDP